LSKPTQIAVPFRKLSEACFLGIGAFFLNAFPASAQNINIDSKPISESLRLNSFGDARLRYHTVDQDAFSENAEALSLQVKGGLELNIFKNSTLLLELEGSANLIENFNDTLNGKTSRPVIGDPENIGVNRFQFQTDLTPDIRLTLGRQHIALDNWRFIGHWPFRQNEQTFDAVRLESKIGRGILDATYVGRVQRQFGNDSPFGEFKGQSAILNYGHPIPFGRVSVFYYGLDLETGEDDSVTSVFSSATSGLRVNGRYKWDDFGLSWDGSIARQTDFADNPNDFAATYASGELNAEYENFTFGGKAEILGSDNGQAVQTPLGALHRLQGAADIFTITPRDGLRDYSLSAGYNLRHFSIFEDVQFRVEQHWFESDALNRSYGQETDFAVSAKFKDFRFGLEYADYNEDGFGSDTRVFILSTEFNFD